MGARIGRVTSMGLRSWQAAFATHEPVTGLGQINPPPPSSYAEPLGLIP
jgi:hypothetical protein